MIIKAMSLQVLGLCLMCMIAVSANGFKLADSTGVSSVPTVKAHAHYDGIISAATDGKYGFVCLGGPSVGLSQGHWRLAIHLYPSLRIGKPEGSPSPLITPTLGTGFYVAYKRIIVLIPFHYISEERQWTGAIGLGWRVSR